MDKQLVDKAREQEAIQREVQNHLMKRKSVIHQGEVDIFEDFRRALNLNHEDVRKLDDFKKLQEIEWFIEVAQLGDGQSFGELALIDNAPRAATITAVEKCSMVIVMRQDYEKVL